MYCILNSLNKAKNHDLLCGAFNPYSHFKEDGSACHLEASLLHDIALDTRRLSALRFSISIGHKSNAIQYFEK